tara:strand:+ start:9860 stop:11176 length:1317 start_codon:yes stop_codon:yes gene_type:complete
MKKNYLSLILALCTTMLFSQNNDFNNGGTDLLWSNPANWSLSVIPTSANTVRLPLIVESLVDADFTIAKIQTIFATSGDTPVAGGSILTIDAGANAVFGIENVSDSDINMIFRGNVTINNSTTDGISNTLMRNQNGNTNDVNGIIFDNGSLLTLTTPLESRTGSGGDIFNFNGNLAGTGALRFGANTTNNFGSTSSNAGFDGDLVYVGANGSVVVNTADNNVFVGSGKKIQVNSDNSSIQINGVNVFQGNISINSSNSFSFDVNNNQNSLGTILFTGGSADGTLNLDIDNSITALAFEDNSTADWGAGTVNITGYQEGVLRFGTDNTGLTTAQLAQISVDGSGGAVALDSDGYLVNESSLSVDEFEADANRPIAYPTIADDKLFFSKTQNNVKIIDLNGKVLFTSKAENQSEVSISFLSNGLYLLVFDNKRVEKFIKK